MPRTARPVTDWALFGSLAKVVWTAVDDVNGETFVNDGKTLLLVQGTAVGPTTATIVSVTDENERIGNVLSASLADDEVSMLFPNRSGVFNQRSGVDIGTVQVDYSGPGLEAAAIRLRL